MTETEIVFIVRKLKISRRGFMIIFWDFLNVIPHAGGM